MSTLGRGGALPVDGLLRTMTPTAGRKAAAGPRRGGAIRTRTLSARWLSQAAESEDEIPVPNTEGRATDKIGTGRALPRVAGGSRLEHQTPSSSRGGSARRIRRPALRRSSASGLRVSHTRGTPGRSPRIVSDCAYTRPDEPDRNVDRRGESLGHGETCPCPEPATLRTPPSPRPAPTSSCGAASAASPPMRPRDG